jgi:hypothetical protein
MADSDATRLRSLWRTVLLREAAAAEIDALEGLLERQRAHFRAKPEKAQLLVAVGASPANTNYMPLELAPWTVVAQAVLSLDEAITKR